MGSTTVTPLKRAKSKSVVHTAAPCSIASADDVELVWGSTRCREASGVARPGEVIAAQRGLPLHHQRADSRFAPFSTQSRAEREKRLGRPRCSHAKADSRIDAQEGLRIAHCKQDAGEGPNAPIESARRETLSGRLGVFRR